MSYAVLIVTVFTLTDCARRSIIVNPYGDCTDFILMQTGIHVTLGRECCQTGLNHYTWCSTYCCNTRSGYFLTNSFYDHCCSTYSDKALFTASSSKCSSFFEENVWVPILIALGSLAVLVGIIVCCVCCVKGCMASNRTGTVVSIPGQQPNTGMVMMNTTMAQQGSSPYQQPYGYGGQSMQPGVQSMQPGGYMQSGQAVHPPGYVGPSLAGPSTYPPPYANPEAEKSGGALPN